MLRCQLVSNFATAQEFQNLLLDNARIRKYFHLSYYTTNEPWFNSFYLLRCLMDISPPILKLLNASEHILGNYGCYIFILSTAYSNTPSAIQSEISSFDIPRNSVHTYSMCSPRAGAGCNLDGVFDILYGGPST